VSLATSALWPPPECGSFSLAEICAPAARNLSDWLETMAVQKSVVAEPRKKAERHSAAAWAATVWRRSGDGLATVWRRSGDGLAAESLVANDFGDLGRAWVAAAPTMLVHGYLWRIRWDRAGDDPTMMRFSTGAMVDGVLRGTLGLEAARLLSTSRTARPHAPIL